MRPQLNIVASLLSLASLSTRSLQWKFFNAVFPVLCRMNGVFAFGFSVYPSRFYSI
jgi:hypothetical protein